LNIVRISNIKHESQDIYNFTKYILYLHNITVFTQINAALVSIRDCFQKPKQTFEWLYK